MAYLQDMPEPVTTFEVDGQAIWVARMQAELDVKEAANTAGISESYLRKLERGIRKHMKPGPYRRLRAALNAAEDELLLAPPRTQDEERK